MTAAVLKAPAPAERSRVLMMLRPGEQLRLEQAGVVVEFTGKSGRCASLCITAPRDLKITRQGSAVSDTSMAG